MRTGMGPTGGERPARGDIAAIGRAAAPAVVVALVLAACGPAGPGTRAAPSDAAVTGTVVTLSDVSDLPDTPDPDGWVVAIPAERAADVLALAGEDRTESDLRYTWFAMSVRTAQRLGGTTGEVDGAGRFRLAARGDVLLCRLVGDRRSDLQTARGCARTVLPETGVVRVTNGEAGLQVSGPDD